MQTMMNDINLGMIDVMNEDYDCLLNTIFTVASCSRMGVPSKEVGEYVYLGRLLNMKNDLKNEIVKRMRAGWIAYKLIKCVIENLKNDRLRANLFNSTKETSLLPALVYEDERKRDYDLRQQAYEKNKGKDKSE
ncbi:hypothetical protein TELCIR_17675 [Teladorsagia circumcincta]|uniref:Uncharacterized protein n=1 Tax=Teladorsagia circumcincta TaxID=45464 RepID=A0A2G9TU80_TELCI|nr:hypothetical protein TELCIR_17675 [Teladorsagia circumcincta]